MRLAVAALVIMLGAAGAGTASARSAEAGDPADRAEQAARQVLDRRYQRELPLAPPVKPGKELKDRDGKPKSPPRRVKRTGDRHPEQRGMESPLVGLMRLVVYGVIAVAVVMLLMWLVRDLKRGTDAAALEGDAIPEPEVDQDVLQRPIGDADELARAGRYAEAIHTLLLRTLIELVRATRTRVPAALTSREILARVPLVPPARAALDALVAAVEVTHFGDEVPGATDYERCRGEFQRFAEAYRGAA